MLGIHSTTNADRNLHRLNRRRLAQDESRAAHAHGVAYAAKAAGLAASHDPTSAGNEARGQSSHVSPAGSGCALATAAFNQRGGMLGALIRDQHTRFIESE